MDCRATPIRSVRSLRHRQASQACCRPWSPRAAAAAHWDCRRRQGRHLAAIPPKPPMGGTPMRLIRMRHRGAGWLIAGYCRSPENLNAGTAEASRLDRRVLSTSRPRRCVDRSTRRT